MTYAHSDQASGAKLGAPPPARIATLLEVAETPVRSSGKSSRHTYGRASVHPPAEYVNACMLLLLIICMAVAVAALCAVIYVQGSGLLSEQPIQEIGRADVSWLQATEFH